MLVNVLQVDFFVDFLQYPLRFLLLLTQEHFLLLRQDFLVRFLSDSYMLHLVGIYESIFFIWGRMRFFSIRGKNILVFINMLKDLENHHESQNKPLLYNFPTHVRAAFIRKVYTLLSFQLFFTCIVSSWFTLDTRVANLVLSEQGVSFNHFTLFANIATLLSLYCCFLNKHPINMILLLLFTIFTAYQIGFVCVYMNAKGQAFVIIEAAASSWLIFSSLTLYVVFTKQDFNFLRIFLTTSLFVFLLFSIVFLMLPIHVSLYNTVFGYAGTVIFSGYILYDTSQLLHTLGPDDYIEATIQLYLDVINLFFSLLQILKRSDF